MKNIYLLYWKKEPHPAANHNRTFGTTTLSSNLKTVLKDAIKNVEDLVNQTETKDTYIRH